MNTLEEHESGRNMVILQEYGRKRLSYKNLTEDKPGVESFGGGSAKAWRELI